jgi:hypothetical protein
LAHGNSRFIRGRTENSDGFLLLLTLWVRKAKAVLDARPVGGIDVDRATHRIKAVPET